MGIEARDGGDFDFPDVELVAGGAFLPDDATRARMIAFPVDGQPVTLTCAGAGGACGMADATLLLLRITDGDLAGSPRSSSIPSCRSGMRSDRFPSTR